MSDGKAASSESGLAARVTPADASQANGEAKFSWADDVETPSTEKPQKTADKDPSLAEAQKDGATTWMMGSQLDEPEFDVNVKLADLQEDPNNPLYSVKSFQDLSLYDPSRIFTFRAWGITHADLTYSPTGAKSSSKACRL